MKKPVILVLVFVLFSSNLFAELITLKDGKMIDAAIIERGSTDITLNDGQRTFRVPLANIKSISKKKAQAEEAKPAEPAKQDLSVAEDIKKGPLFKLVPTDDELKIAEYEAFMAIKSMQTEMEAIRAEQQQMKVLAGIAAGAVLVGIIVVFIAR